MTTPRDQGAERRDSHPDLIALTRCELSNADALLAGDHLADCAGCREELARLVVGASMIGRAARTLSGTPVLPVTTESLPPLVLADPHSRGRRRWLLGAAAVVAVAVGAVGAGVVLNRDGAAPLQAAPTAPSPSDLAAPERSVDLASVLDDGAGPTPAGQASGRVVMSAGDAATRLTFATDGLPRAAADEFYEAWLLDPATDKMLPLGVVSGASETTFEVANSLMSQYAAIDLSLEADNGDPDHSETSVLRGAY